MPKEKNVKSWELMFKDKISQLATIDAAHDFLHIQRVVNTARQLCAEQNADANVVIPAAWLHDFIVVPKDDPLRAQASQLAAKAASEYLRSINYPEQFHDAISHAIESHSYSANIAPQTLEAKIVQDADRLDAVGAIGIARCFTVGGMLNRQIYRETDPLCESREPNDQLYTVDHFYKKLFRIVDTLNTESGRAEGVRRKAVMVNFLEQLGRETIA